MVRVSVVRLLLPSKTKKKSLVSSVEKRVTVRTGIDLGLATSHEPFAEIIYVEEPRAFVERIVPLAFIVLIPAVQ